MNKPELSARIATEAFLSTASADAAATAVLSAIDDALASGETDRIAGFGTFSKRSRPAHRGRNHCARARASPSTPRRRLPSRPVRPSARPSTSRFEEREYRCRTAPIRRGVNGRGKSSGSVSAPPLRCRSTETPIRQPVRSRRNRIASAFAVNVPGTSRRDPTASDTRAKMSAVPTQESATLRMMIAFSEQRSRPSYPKLRSIRSRAASAALTPATAQAQTPHERASTREPGSLQLQGLTVTCHGPNGPFVTVKPSWHLPINTPLAAAKRARSEPDKPVCNMLPTASWPFDEESSGSDPDSSAASVSYRRPSSEDHRPYVRVHMTVAVQRGGRTATMRVS